MLTTSDKAWVAGLVTYVGHLLATKLGLSWLVTPELVAILAGAATWWVPNKGTPPPSESGSRTTA